MGYADDVLDRLPRGSGHDEVSQRRSEARAAIHTMGLLDGVVGAYVTLSQIACIAIDPALRGIFRCADELVALTVDERRGAVTWGAMGR